MPRALGRSLLVLLVGACALALGPLAPAALAAGVTYQVVSSTALDKIDNSQDGSVLQAPAGGRILKVRLKVDKTGAAPMLFSSLDYTLHYTLETSLGGAPLSQSTVRPCEGLRWQGTQVNENGQWLLLSENLRKQGGAVEVAQTYPGSYYLDLAFIVHQGVDEVQVFAGLPQGSAVVKQGAGLRP